MVLKGETYYVVEGKKPGNDLLKKPQKISLNKDVSKVYYAGNYGTANKIFRKSANDFFKKNPKKEESDIYLLHEDYVKK